MIPAVLALRSIFLRNQRLSAWSLGGMMLLISLAMGLFSLTSLNDKAMKGYLVNKLENERQALVRDGEITDMLILRARAYETIEGSESVQNMVKAHSNQVVYVTPVTVVAQR